MIGYVQWVHAMLQCLMATNYPQSHMSSRRPGFMCCIIDLHFLIVHKEKNAL